MSEIDKMARELLAGELRNRGRHGAANKVMQGRPAMFIEEIAAIRAALLAAPTGWKLVPVEPTDEMLWGADEIEVGYPAWAGSRDTCSDDEARKIWAAMIAAAPEPK